MSRFIPSLHPVYSLLPSISKPDSVLVVAGFIILCLVPVFLVYIYRRIHNIINNKQKGKANEVV